MRSLAAVCVCAAGGGGGVRLQAELRVVPNLIFVVEDLEKHLVKLAKASKCSSLLRGSTLGSLPIRMCFSFRKKKKEHFKNKTYSKFRRRVPYSKLETQF